MRPIEELGHSTHTLSRWVNELKFFYYIRRWGGWANDGDSFTAYIPFTAQNLREMVARIELEQPTYFPGGAKVWDPSNIGPNQCGWALLFGHNVFVRVDKEFTVQVSGTADGNHYDVTETDFDVCRVLEKRFTLLGFVPYRPQKYERGMLYVTCANYPELCDGASQ